MFGNVLLFSCFLPYSLHLFHHNQGEHPPGCSLPPEGVEVRMVTGRAHPGIINLLRSETTVFQELLVDQGQVQCGLLLEGSKVKLRPFFGKQSNPLGRNPVTTGTDRRTD